ncbi:MAG TPA: hypothetical protein VFU88_02700 [Ktedonobacterales bacterium]|nr:hypothetical protein [Ktedonobacterales bacterium]
MLENPSIDYVMLANHVEAVNGLLYISGGGWTDHHRVIQPGSPPPVSHLGIAVSVRIPWTQTNQPHRLTVRVEDEDAAVVVVRADAQLSVGRPANLPQGAEQHAVLGLSVETTFPKASGYRVIAVLDDDLDTRTWAFRVHDVPAPLAVLPPAP